MELAHAKRTEQRLRGWWMVTLGALVVVAYIAHQQVAVLLYKLLQVTLAVTLAYFADRTLFRHTADIDEDLDRGVFGAGRLIARAIVALAVILGITMGI